MPEAGPTHLHGHLAAIGLQLHLPGHATRHHGNRLQALERPSVEHQLGAPLQLPNQGDPVSGTIHADAQRLGIGPVEAGQGQGLLALLGQLLALDQSLLIGGLAWPPALLWVPALALSVSLVAALLPTLGAYRVSVQELLQPR